MRRSEVEIGKRFGRLTVTKDLLCDEKHVHWVECLCDCGQVKKCNLKTLKHGGCTSCGCYRLEQLRSSYEKKAEKTNPKEGDVFGDLTVVRFLEKRGHGNYYYLCKCSCGNTCEVPKSFLLNGSWKSCGCKQQEHGHNVHSQKARERRSYSDWFISKLANDDLRKQAKESLFTTEAVVLFKCDHCHKIFKRKASSVLRVEKKYDSPMCLCSLCSNHVSIFENDVSSYIESIVGQDKVERNVRSLLRSKTGGCLEIDIYVPSKNFGVECNGNYWHSVEQGKYPTYHQEKFQCAESVGIHLVQIYESDWKDNQDKIKSALHDMLSSDMKVIGARKLSISKVSSSEAQQFYEENHLQGRCSASCLNYGLYDNEILMCCMGFGSSKYHAGNLDCDWELHRYSVRKGYVIKGGAERLLKVFENEKHPKALLSYSANDFFKGDMYSRLGFTFTGYADTPRYFWFTKDETVLRREACQLKYLKEKYPDLYEYAERIMVANKENFIMRNLEAVQCYRAGNKRWVKTY